MKIKSLITNLIKRRQSKNALTFLRESKRFYASENEMITYKVFRNDKDMMEFFRAVCYSRTHI